MNRHERITSGEKKKRPAGAIAGKKPAASAETKRSVNAAQAKPSLNVADAINDIAQRSGNLLKKQTQKLNDDDCYQVIDPRTVAAAMGECARRATFDPAALYKQQLALWNDLANSYPFSLLCGYSLGNSYQQGAYEQICNQHTHVVSASGQHALIDIV